MSNDRSNIVQRQQEIYKACKQRKNFRLLFLKDKTWYRSYFGYHNLFGVLRVGDYILVSFDCELARLARINTIINPRSNKDRVLLMTIFPLDGEAGVESHQYRVGYEWKYNILCLMTKKQ